MLVRRTYPPLAPRISFTNDFHELLRGDLAPGQTFTIRYDPLRIVPAGDGYIFGDPNRPITAYAVFKPGDAPLARPLIAPSGPVADPDIDPTGNGDMLEATLEIPEDAQEVELWFAYASLREGLRYDSDNGANFHFGFPRRQIGAIDADMTSRGEGSSVFALRVGAVPDVTQVMVRLRDVTRPGSEKTEIDLQPGQNIEGGWKVWTLPEVEVPSDAVLQFKLYYWRDGVRYKDDNDGVYYLSAEPLADAVPPPPSALARAAKRWS